MHIKWSVIRFLLSLCTQADFIRKSTNPTCTQLYEVTSSSSLDKFPFKTTDAGPSSGSNISLSAPAFATGGSFDFCK